MALIMRFSGHFPGVRRVRQHGDGDSCRQRQHLILGLRAVAKIVNNDGEFGQRTLAPPEPANRLRQEQLREIEAKLIFPTTAVD